MYKQNSPSLNPLSIENITNNTHVDPTRRKRLKVLNACNECRRKKTKCNGEKPCAGCLKANVECQYVHNNVKKTPSIQQQQRPTIVPITPRATTSTQPSRQGDPMMTLWHTVQSIEGRLSTIENILQLLLQQQQQNAVHYYHEEEGQKKRKLSDDLKLPSPHFGHSDASSICSSIPSPKITAIQSLLNNEKSSTTQPTIHCYF